MHLLASNFEMMEKMGVKPPDPGGFSSLWSQVPGAGSPPGSAEAIEAAYRDWLALFGAVPKKDYEDLKKKHQALESEAERLRQAMQSMAKGMAGFKEAPEVMKPWMDLAERTLKDYMGWLSEFQAKDAAGDKAKSPEAVNKELQSENEKTGSAGPKGGGA